MCIASFRVCQRDRCSFSESGKTNSHLSRLCQSGSSPRVTTPKPQMRRDASDPGSCAQGREDRDVKGSKNGDTHRMTMSPIPTTHPFLRTGIPAPYIRVPSAASTSVRGIGIVYSSPLIPRTYTSSSSSGGCMYSIPCPGAWPSP